MEPYPERLGVFPLPHVVLFPHAHLPLHVFEPRYLSLLKEALAADRRFVMAVLKPGYEAGYYGNPEVYPVACAGRIVKHQRLDDDCADLVLCGERVVHLEEFVAEEPFRIAKIRSRPEDDEFARAPGAAERLAQMRELLDRACPGATQALESRLIARPEQDGGLELLHTLASSFPLAVEQKLAWLECEGSLARWERIRATLEGVARERGRKDRAMERYADLKPEDPKHN
ncbi:MAG: LON peptidase substrate-binding domain-containing protein [bacterium]